MWTHKCNQFKFHVHFYQLGLFSHHNGICEASLALSSSDVGSRNLKTSNLNLKFSHFVDFCFAQNRRVKPKSQMENMSQQAAEKPSWANTD